MSNGDTTMSMYHTLHIKAPHSRNGNVNRAYAVYGPRDGSIQLLGVYDEDLEGEWAIPQHLQSEGCLKCLHEVNVTVSEYRRWLKLDPRNR